MKTNDLAENMTLSTENISFYLKIFQPKHVNLNP